MRQWRKENAIRGFLYPIVHLTCRERSNDRSKKKVFTAVLTERMKSIEDEEIIGSHELPLAFLHLVVDSAERFLDYNTIYFTGLQF